MVIIGGAGAATINQLGLETDRESGGEGGKGEGGEGRAPRSR